MRKPNQLKVRLAHGEFVLGTYSVLPSAAVANVIAAANLDYIVIDMEHGPFSLETAENMVRAIESEGKTPLVRVPTNADWFILRGLEIGAHGIVIPQIGSPENAKSAISAMKYAPEGHRGLSPFSRSGGYTALNSDNLSVRENKETLSILLVEGVEGIENLDAILEVPGIDVIYLGIYDLSQSIGFPGQVNHPEVVNFVEECVKKIRSKGIAAGCFAQNVNDIKNLRKLGVQFIAYLTDSALLYHACLDVRSAFDE